jgi:ParB-like chromosome segregation protein Spo0J
MLAGLNEISAIIEEIDNDEDVLIQSTIENILRKDKNPVPHTYTLAQAS